MPLKHLVMSVDQENEFYRNNPGVHLVKAIVTRGQVHIWIADNKSMNGGHMQRGGADNGEWEE
jgi:hypothetical protein